MKALPILAVALVIVGCSTPVASGSPSASLAPPASSARAGSAPASTSPSAPSRAPESATDLLDCDGPVVGGASFTIEEMRTCDPSEYGAMVDLGPHQRVWAHEETGEVLTDIAGPGHCGWESARMLHLSNEDGTLAKQYLRDPLGVFDDVPALLDTYAEGVELLADATFSGYQTVDGLELWFTPDDRAAYVVTPDGVERWPRADEPIGCA